MTLPTWMLCAFAIAIGMVSALGEPFQAPRRAEPIASVALGFLMAWWVVTDARRRGRRLCHDYDSFVYFAWPVLVPVYLFQTRGIRAFLTLGGFVVLWLIAGTTFRVVLLMRNYGS